ncbi:MAG: helix-turn-helix domain-containing protein [Cyanobacteria bacterium P01_G01_bin.67]
MSKKHPQSCSLEKLLNQISGLWTIYIIWILDNNNSLRFGELGREVEGISTKVLTERLRKLEAMGVVYRNYKPTIPPQVSYGLTNQGKELSRTLDPLCKLASRWYGDDR